MTRTAEEIRHTDTGPRPVPAIGPRQPAPIVPHVDTVLPNGLRVIAARKPGAAVVQIRLAIPHTVTDRPSVAQVAMLGTCLLAGTERRDRVAVENEISHLGGQLAVSWDGIGLSASGAVSAHGFDAALDILTDALTGATYIEDEVERARALTMQQLQVAMQQPAALAEQALQDHRYGGHPAARTLPDLPDVAAVTPEQLRDLHTTVFTPQGAYLVIVGDIAPAETIQHVQQATTTWTSPLPAGEPTGLTHVPGCDLLGMPHPGAVQSNVRLSAPAIAPTDPRFPALYLATVIFGGGHMNSRLMSTLREEQALTYHTRASLENVPGREALTVAIDTAADKTAAAVQGLRDELTRLAKELPTQQELDLARNYTIGADQFSCSSQMGLADRLTDALHAGLDMHWLTRFADQLAEVTLDQVTDAIRVFFAADRFTGVVVAQPEILIEKVLPIGGVRMPEMPDA